MRTRYWTRCLLACLGLLLAGGVGCTQNGIHATSEGELTEPDTTGTTTQAGSRAGTKQSADAQSRAGGVREQELTSQDLGTFGNGGSGDDPFASSGRGQGDASSGGAMSLDPDGRAGSGVGAGPGGRSGGGGFIGAEGQEAGEGLEGETGFGPAGESLESFPEVGTGDAGSSGDALRGFESVEPDGGLAEDRVEQGTMIAKAEPSEAFQSQLDSLAEERRRAVSGDLRDIFFRYDSWGISDDAKELLRRNAGWLEANPSSQLLVEGHCDERGSSAYNLVLGDKRARAVRNYLIELGVNSSRLRMVSYGEERPFCRDPTDTCHQLNRRSHFVLQ